MPAVPKALVTIANNKLKLQVSSTGRFVCTLGTGVEHSVDVPGQLIPMPVTGPWRLSFPAGWGAPPSVGLVNLISWSAHPDNGVKHFSGTARYSTTMLFPDTVDYRGPADLNFLLDLGRVAVMAKVYLNGKLVGTCWKPPFVLDVTPFIHAGHNTLDIDVANLWINRLIGDESLPEDCERAPDGHLLSWPKWLQEGKPSPTGRLTFTTWQLWHKTDMLHESGLLGPVQLIPVRSVTI